MLSSASHASCLEPQWDAPDNVKAVFTTRQGGKSAAPFDRFNLGHHVGDQERSYADNRSSLLAFEGLEHIQWLDQVHGKDIARAGFTEQSVTADASYTNQPALACAVLTADCLPVLFCDDTGTEIAAAHAGWRSLAAGILVNTVARFNAQAPKIKVCFGPCIGKCHFEVGEDVFQAFSSAESFAPCKSLIAEGFEARVDKYFADLKYLAKIQLQSIGVESVTSNSYCTYCDEKKFFSYRRTNKTGRMASFIYRC
jgi:YfiH family protein